MSYPTHRPTRASGAIALLVAACVLVLSLQIAFPVFLTVSLGMLAFGAGIVRGSRGWLAVGGVGLFAGMLLAGLIETSPVFPLAGTAAALIAWDIGEHAINVGEQLGREADTSRQEVVHAGLSVCIGGLALGVALAVDRLSVVQFPVSALLVGLGATLVLIAILRNC